MCAPTDAKRDPKPAFDSKTRFQSSSSPSNDAVLLPREIVVQKPGNQLGSPESPVTATASALQHRRMRTNFPSVIALFVCILSMSSAAAASASWSESRMLGGGSASVTSTRVVVLDHGQPDGPGFSPRDLEPVEFLARKLPACCTRSCAVAIATVDLVTQRPVHKELGVT